MSEKYEAINSKLMNRKDVYSDKINVLEKENKITNNLLYYYDKNFDSYYNTNEKLDSNIKTNEKIISINNDEFVQKNNKVFILKNFLLLILFNIVIVILHTPLHLYSRTTLLLLIFISVLYYIWSVINHIYFNKFVRGKYLSDKFAYDSSSSIFKEAIRDILPNYMTRDKCPKGCRQKHIPSRCPKNMPNCQEINPARINDLRTDSTLNNWADGDILYQECSVINPTDLTDIERSNAIKSGITLNNRLMKCPLKNGGSIIMNEPQPWYSGIKDDIHSNTVYKCEWEDVGEPIGDQGYSFNSKIPCDYYIGYKTVETRIGGEKV